ncbi:hypothetical protein PR003_g153 [Phytophthora rubi]|uniref:Uncharacterized protein n=1 Tax=Phytophthora rubi TaxID=129364 RepID=A0A6A3P0P3_9STRA|nr:hypothetical protein PR002_g113 [Phytophthora rubi]KAE9360541.1 hypothetical protein PR003_g153 [Phytophthora rubi]
MQPRVSIRPRANGDGNEPLETGENKESHDEVESNDSQDTGAEVESDQNEDACEEGDLGNESEHGDVASVGDDATSETAGEKGSAETYEDQPNEEDTNADVLREYDDVVVERDLHGAEQESVDESQQIMDIETYRLEDDDVKETIEQTRALVDHVRSFSEQSKRREKSGRDSIAGRREAKRCNGLVTVT